MDKAGYNSSNDQDDVSNIPRPYVVEICKSTKKIASIRRNWRPEDNNFKRIECFVKWNFMPGLGMYGNGLGQLMGSNTIVLTNALRQTVDSITFGNFPGGFIKRAPLQMKTILPFTLDNLYQQTHMISLRLKFILHCHFLAHLQLVCN